MVTVTINGTTVPADRANEGWVNQMLADARSRGVAPCVQINVSEPTAQIFFATPGCPRGPAGTKQWTPTELRLIDVWTRRGLGSGQFSPGELRAFLNEVQRLV